MNGSSVATHVEVRSWLAQVDPRLKLAWLAAISLVAVLVDSLTALLTLTAFAALPLLGVRMTRAAWALLLGLVAVGVWSTVLSQGMFYGMEPLTPVFALGPLRVYQEGMFYGLVQSLRFVASVVAGVLVVVSTSPERLLAALVSLRVPSAIAFVAVSALRALPTLIDQWASIRQARRLRLGHRRRNPFTAVVDECRLVVPLVAIALRRAAILSTSVISRGFRAGQPRTFYPPLHMLPSEYAVGSAMGFACTAIAALKTLQWLAQSKTLDIPVLEPYVRWAETFL